jgi:hypothetical protein
MRGERLLHPKRVGRVVVIGGIGAEDPVAGGFVEVDRAGVVLAHLEAKADRALGLRGVLRGGEQRARNTVPPRFGRDREGIEPGERGAAPEQHGGVAEDRAAPVAGDKRRLVPAFQQVLEAAAAQPIAVEARILDRQQRVDIRRRRRPDRGRVGFDLSSALEHRHHPPTQAYQAAGGLPQGNRDGRCGRHSLSCGGAYAPERDRSKER